MQKKHVGIFLSALGVGLVGCGTSTTKEDVRKGTSPGATSTSSQLTVYQQGFGLVKEVRDFNLKAGRQNVFVENVAQKIEPDSVAIRSISAPGSFEVLEQNYRYDLISNMAILSKAVGGTTILNRVLPNGNREQIEGTLMSGPTLITPVDGESSSNTYDGMVIKTKDGRILLNPSGEVEMKSIPEELISKPTLVWDLDCEKAGANQVELSYITQGITWSSDYVLQLDDAGTSADLKGWVTMKNQTGAAFQNCTLKLLAGDVQRDLSAYYVSNREPKMAPAAAPKSESQMKEETFADYHLYTLPRPATVRNNENKQLSLLEAFKIPVTKKIVFDPMRDYGDFRPSESEEGTGVMKAKVSYEFSNDKMSNMGMPLPEGSLKIFQHDSTGATQLLGEDHIEHTPSDEKLKIMVGKAFDIVAERKRTSFQYIYGSHRNPIGARESFVTELRNRKNAPETITLIERYWGDWKVSSSSDAHTKLDANSIQFQIPLKAGEVRKLIYSFETKWAKD